MGSECECCGQSDTWYAFGMCRACIKSLPELEAKLRAGGIAITLMQDTLDEYRAKVERLEKEKATMHENMKTVVGAGVGVKQQLATLEALCREVVEAREKIFNVGHDFKHGQIAELYLELHDKIDAMAEAIDKLRKEVE